MIWIEDLDIVARMKRFVVLDPNEIGTGFGNGGASHVDSATNKTISFFGVIFEPTRLIWKKEGKINEKKSEKNQ